MVWKKFIYNSVLFLSIGCNKKETRIELPNQLKWGINVDDVKHKGISISYQGESVDHNYQYFVIETTAYPELDFKSAIFKKMTDYLAIFLVIC